jgi:hypothetical protein
VTAEPDFALGGLDPADIGSEQAESVLWAEDLQVLAEHHTPDQSRSYVVAHDTSVTWGVPGSPQVAAITISRDLDRGTFTLDSEYHAGLPFAQAWLIERGCPPEQITVPDGMFIEPADDLTRRVEQKIRAAGQRYDVLDTYTRDYDPYESWTLVRDTLADQDPVRVFLEQGNPKTFTYTVREGAFPDEDTAQDWLDDRSTPFPQAPEDHLDAATLRTRAALARSTGRPGSVTVCGLDSLPATAPAPAPVSVQRPDPGRSL